MSDQPITTGPDVTTTVVSDTPIQTTGVEAVEGQAAPPPLDPEYVSRASRYVSADALPSLPRHVVEQMIGKAEAEQRDVFDRAMKFAEQQYNPVQRQPNGQFAPQQQQPQQQPGGFAFDPFELKFEGDEDADSPIAKKMLAAHEWNVAQLNKVHQHYQQQLGAHQQSVASIRQERTIDLMDNFIASLPPERRAVFGTGSLRDLHPSSQEFLKASALETAAMEEKRREYAYSMGTKVISDAEALRRAERIINRDLSDAAAQAAAARTKFEAGATDRPRSPGAPPAMGGSNRDRAAAMVASMRH